MKNNKELGIRTGGKHKGDSTSRSMYYGLFKSHYHMIGRCHDEKHKSYETYGAKGVTVCNEWHNYLTFRKWALKNGWRKNLVISRFGDTGNYEPSNASWTTRVANTIEALSDNWKKRRKLTDEQVREVRKTTGLSQQEIANKLCVTRGTIQAILNGTSYRDVL